MKYYIVTGGSRGLGAAMIQGLMAPDHVVFNLSRKDNINLQKDFATAKCQLTQIHCDLNQVELLDEVMDQVFRKIHLMDGDQIYLINNAGTVHPIKQIEHARTEEIITAFHVNSIAPVILTARFIEKTQDFLGVKRVLNISSGAGNKPYEGWSTYCATKSALDMFTQVVGKEQDSKKGAVLILSLAPGIVDTDMQREIREATAEDFPLLNRFQNYKKNGDLWSPEFVAERVLSLLHGDDFDQGDILDIRDYV